MFRTLSTKIGLIALLPSWVVLDTVLAGARGWWSDSRLDHAVLLLCGAWLVFLVAAVLTQRGRRWVDRNGSKVCLAIVSLALAWGAGECIVRFARNNQPAVPFHVHYPHLHKRFKPAPGVMPGIHGESLFTTNALGIRGPEFPAGSDTLKILCVGGSTTICTYLDDTETWPYLVAERLNDGCPERPVWVGSVGMSGFAAIHHLEFVRASPLVEDMDWLIFLVGINDVTRTLLGTNDVLEQPAPSETSPPWWRSSRILQAVRELWNWRAETRSNWVEDDAGRNYVKRRRLRQAGTVRLTGPDLMQPLDVYETRLREIVEACQSRQIRPIFLTQPVLWGPELSEEARSLLWLGQLRDGSYLSVEGLADAMLQFNERLRMVCQESACLCIDLQSMDGQLECFYDDCHYTEAGARQVVGLVTQQLAALVCSP